MRTRASGLLALAAVAIALSVVGCTRSGDDKPDEPAASSPAATAEPSAAPEPTTPEPTTPEPTTPEHAVPVPPLVLAISVDGLNPDALDLLGSRRAPNLHRLMREGSSTLNARTAYELTITLPNHTGMLTGRGVEGRSGHGVTFNDDTGGTLASSHGVYVPGAFDIAHDHGVRTAFFAEKEKFAYLMRSWDGQNGAPDVTGDDDGRDKTDADRVATAETLIPQVAQELLNADTGLMFLHLSGPDRAGHADGWLGTSYLDAVGSVDRQLGSLLEIVDSNPQARERVTILLTADHGGARGLTSHDDATREANYRVPFIAWGRGVARGADLYVLNAGRSDPAGGRPDYTGAQPVRNIDIANTALSLLALPPVAGSASSEWPPLRLE